MILPTQLTLSKYGKLSKEHFCPLVNREFVKPYGGLWSSSYTPDSEYLSAWHEFCGREFSSGFRPFSILFDIKKDSRIYTIDNQKDLMQLISEFGSYDGVMAEHLRNAGLDPIWIYPDFERVSQEYDIIHLTVEGQGRTRMPMNNHKYNLYGWDVESCLIMNFDVIENQSLLE